MVQSVIFEDVRIQRENYNNENPIKKLKEEAVEDLVPEITIRAESEKARSVTVPCCQTLGPPNEEKVFLVIGGFDVFQDIYKGENGAS